MNKVLSTKPQTPFQVWKILPLLGFVGIFAVLGRDASLLPSTLIGNPYTRIGSDINGRAGIEWGVYGVPETFVIGRDGRDVHKHIGAITPKVLNETLLTLIRRLQKKPATVSTAPMSNKEIS